LLAGLPQYHDVFSVSGNLREQDDRARVVFRDGDGAAEEEAMDFLKRSLHGIVFCALALFLASGWIVSGAGAGPDGQGTGVSTGLEGEDRPAARRPMSRSNPQGNPLQDSNQPVGIAVDSQGNAYVTGQWVNTSGNSDFATIKYSKAGAAAWVRHYNGPAKGDDLAGGIAVDSAGNAYVTGASPGTGTQEDFATVKYSRSGEQQWIRRYNGPVSRSDWPTGIAVDSSGNAYVTGDSQVSDTRWDFTTVKYDSAGKQLWAKRYNGPLKGSSRPSGIAVDSFGNAYVTGTSQSGESEFDFATVKYDSSGKQIWARRHTRSGSSVNYPVGLAVSKSSVYVSGGTQGSSSSQDYTTVSYDKTTGNRKWVKNFDSGTGNDNPSAVAACGNVGAYVTGSSGDGDFLTVKYDSSGALVWTKRYNGPARGSDFARAIAVDSSGAAYVTGQSDGSGTGTDFATIKYGPGGKTCWVQRFNGKGNGQDTPSAIAVDSAGNVYVTGQSQLSSSDDFGFATVKYDSSGKRTWVKYYSGQ